ncbi:MAG: CHAT domain-containing protein [Leptolyngbya sp. BL-A-14]
MHSSLKIFATRLSLWSIMTSRHDRMRTTATVGSLLAIVALTVIAGSLRVEAQSIQPARDGTNTIISSPPGNPNQFNISGGTQAGSNLFQSFQQFGLSQGQSAVFQANPQIQNVLARVVGGNPSIINGLLQVMGSNANLYLMNPSGILFGANASLNVPASFTATTATGIGFGTNWFNANGVNNYGLLTGIPETFAFTTLQPGAIVNFGNLAVGTGQNLTLLAGTALSTGQLSAPGGQVTVAAVPAQSLVRVSQTGSMLNFDLQPVTSSPTLPQPWSLPIASLPQLLTGGSASNANGVRVNPDGTVQLTGSGILVQTGKATVIAGDRVQLSSVFENSSGVFDQAGALDEFGSLIIRFDNAPNTTVSTDVLQTELVATAPPAESVGNAACLAIAVDETLPPDQNQASKSLTERQQPSDRTSPNQRDRATQPFRQATQQYAAQDYRPALASYQASLSLYQANGDRPCMRESLYWIGNSYRHLGQYPQAIASYQQALAVPLNDRASEGRILNNLGATYQLLGQYAQALTVQQQALSLRRETHDRSGEGSTLSNIGALYSSLGKYPQALESYQQAIAVFQTLNDRQAVGDVLSNLGLIDDSLGQYNQALERYQQVLAIRKETGDRPGEGTALHNLGLVQRHLGHYQQALALNQQALAVRQSLNDRPGTGETLGNLGDVYERLGQYPQALESLNQALSIAQALGRRDSEADILATTATVERRLGNPSQALTLYQEALGIQRAIGNRASERRTLSYLGDLYRQHQPGLAIAFYKQSVNVSEAIRQDIRVLSRDAQESYTQTVAPTYRSLADVLLSQGRILEAQQVLERLKIQEIRQFTRGASAAQQTGVTLTPTEDTILKEHGTLIAFGQQVYECKQSRCPQLSHLNDELQSLTQQYNQTIQSFAPTIRERRAQDEGFLDPTKLLPKARAIVDAQPGTVLIYPLVLKDKIWLIWASRGGVVKSVQVPVSEQQLGETVLKFRQSLQSPILGTKAVKATGNTLYNWLIKPLEPELTANHIQHLVFSLDRVTRYIPMSALFNGSQYLIENYTIHTVLSADLTDTRDRPALSPRTTPVLGAGVSEGLDDFSPLPNVPLELNGIVKQPPSETGIYPGVTFLNRAFDFRTLRDNLLGHKIIHIATHAQFVPGRPEDSFLVLGTGDKLTIPEIQTLQDLSEVQLVVLSACETALGGPDQDGIEISGLSSYFLNAGAKAVVASLWTVDDASTSQLMRSFYSNLSTESTQAKMTKAEALRRAQLSLLYSNDGTTKGSAGLQGTQSHAGQFSHPFFWAPFILIGNGL